MASEESKAGVQRGQTVALGPFECRVPNRDCQITGCEEKADGVVDMEGKEKTLSCCIGCAPQFLGIDGAEWTPLAGGRSLPQGGDQP